MGRAWGDGFGIQSDPPRSFLTPAIATILFFSIHFFLSFVTGPDRTDVSAAVVEPPTTTPMRIRVVQSIQPLDEAPRALTPVPDNETDLFELFSRDGSVIFGEGEVEPVATPAHKFDAGEVGVITVQTKLRRARYRR